MPPPSAPTLTTSQKVDAHVKPLIDFYSAMKKRNKILMEATV